MMIILDKCCYLLLKVSKVENQINVNRTHKNDDNKQTVKQEKRCSMNDPSMIITVSTTVNIASVICTIALLSDPGSILLQCVENTFHHTPHTLFPLTPHTPLIYCTSKIREEGIRKN